MIEAVAFVIVAIFVVFLGMLALTPFLALFALVGAFVVGMSAVVSDFIKSFTRR